MKESNLQPTIWKGQSEAAEPGKSLSPRSTRIARPSRKPAEHPKPSGNGKAIPDFNSVAGSRSLPLKSLEDWDSVKWRGSEIGALR